VDIIGKLGLSLHTHVITQLNTLMTYGGYYDYREGIHRNRWASN
jgi:hypothetical protein